MTTLAVSSQKGGVGKTTVALNLAFALARRGWKTLLFDTDPQGAVGNSLQGTQGKGAGAVSCLRGESDLAQAVLPTRLAELDLLTVGPAELSGPQSAAALLQDAEALGKLLAQAKESYPLVVVDTPSGMHGITRTVLDTAEFLLVPLQAEPLALRTVAQVVGTVGDVREAGNPLRLAGFVITMLNSRDDVSLSVAQESWSTLPTDLILDAAVPRDSAFLAASAHGVPLALLSRRPPPVASVFDQIAAELEPRLDLIAPEAQDAPISLLD